MSLNNTPIIFFLILSYLKLCIDFPPTLNFWAPASQQLYWILLSKCAVVTLLLLCGCCSHPLRGITLFLRTIFACFSWCFVCACVCFSMLIHHQFSPLGSVSLQPHELQHARPPCPSPTPRAHPNPRPLSRWCHPTISSSRHLLLLPSILPSIRVFSNDSALRIRWPKYWSFVIHHKLCQFSKFLQMLRCIRGISPGTSVQLHLGTSPWSVPLPTWTFPSCSLCCSSCSLYPMLPSFW